MELIIIFYFSLFLTVLSTPILIEYFSRHKIMDYPGERKINTHAVPRMGGTVIFISAMISIIGFFNDLTELRFFLLGSLSLLMVGIFDDIKDISYQKKFAIQFIAAFFLLIFLSRTYNSIIILGFVLPSPFDKILLVIFIVGVINSINLYDGLDGLVTGFSLLISFVTFCFGWQLNDQFLMILSASLIGSLIGFLKYNIFPARIFLGDSGSLTLGFFLITAVLISSTNPTTKNIDLSFSIILLAVPVIDTLRVMTSRILNLKNPFLPDLSHVHHIILSSDISHVGTLIILQGFSVIFTIIAIFYLVNSGISWIFLFGLFAIVLLHIKKIIAAYKKFSNYILVKKLSLKSPMLVAFLTLIQDKDSKWN